MPRAPKINILNPIRPGPWGGGNQFLKALRKDLRMLGFYIEDPRAAQFIIFNGYPFGAEYLFRKIWQLKKQDPRKVILLRLDGPISMVRGRDIEIDRILAQFSRLFVDGIIFQSHWSRKQNKKYFQISAPFEIVIHNAPDPHIFYKRKVKSLREKFKIITTVWSPNPRKGFSTYQYLDRHLDFTQYAMTLVGNMPISYKNIRCLQAVPPLQIATLLRKHDLFLTASQNDPCSNALIEALTCGLPCLAYQDGGHPELIGQGGLLFKKKREILPALKKIRQNYYSYQKRLPMFSLRKTTLAYYRFGQQIWEDSLRTEYQLKQIPGNQHGDYLFLRAKSFLWQIQNRLRPSQK